MIGALLFHVEPDITYGFDNINVCRGGNTFLYLQLDPLDLKVPSGVDPNGTGVPRAGVPVAARRRIGRDRNLETEGGKIEKVDRLKGFRLKVGVQSTSTYRP